MGDGGMGGWWDGGWGVGGWGMGDGGGRKHLQLRNCIASDSSVPLSYRAAVESRYRIVVLEDCGMGEGEGRLGDKGDGQRDGIEVVLNSYFGARNIQNALRQRTCSIPNFEN